MIPRIAICPSQFLQGGISLLLYIGGMRILALQRFLLTILLSVVLGFAADSAQKSKTDVKSDDKLDSTKTHVLGNIDVFGQEAIGTMFVLTDHFDFAIEIKKSIDEKSFATDEFFMQNIDREQFEQERLLKLFGEDKKQYFQLFPDAKHKDDDDDDDN